MKIKVSKELEKKLEKKAKENGFINKEFYIKHILEQAMRGCKHEEYEEYEEEDVKKSLRKLGYLQE